MIAITSILFIGYGKKEKKNTKLKCNIVQSAVGKQSKDISTLFACRQTELIEKIFILLILHYQSTYSLNQSKSRKNYTKPFS